ncbi:MAG: hypothetical protein ABJB74_18830 [Gemmatimonas sp.]
MLNRNPTSMPANRPRSVLPRLTHASVLFVALLVGCDPEGNPPKLEVGSEDVILQGGTLPLPVVSAYGTTLTIQPPSGGGLTIAPLTYQNILGTEFATITAAPNAGIGLRVITVTGTNGYGSGARSQTLTVVVHVDNPFTVEPVFKVSGRAGQLISGEVELDAHSLFKGPVAFKMLDLPPNSVATFGPLIRDKSTFTILTPDVTPPRTYQATIEATSGAIVRTEVFDVEVLIPLITPDFSFTIAPNVLSILPNGTVVADLAFKRNVTATGNIVLSATGLPPRVTATFSPSPVSNDFSRLTLTADNATPDIPYTVAITGVANGETRTEPLKVTVVPVPNFTLTPAADTITLQNPLTTFNSVAINIGRTGQVGPVSLAVDSVPAGVTAAFTASPATGLSSTLVFAPSGNTVPGNYTVKITGTADGLTKVTRVVVKVLPSLGDFSLSFTSPSYNVVQGSINALGVNLVRSGTLVGSVISLTPTTVPPLSMAVAAPPTTTSTAAFINLTVDANAPVGAHVLKVAATGGGLTRTDSAVINIVAPPPPGFRLAAIPAQFQLPRDSFTPFAIGITRISGFAGPVTLSFVNPFPGNMIIDFTPLPSAPDVIRVNVYVSTNINAGTYNISFTGTSGALSETIIVPVIVTP